MEKNGTISAKEADQIIKEMKEFTQRTSTSEASSNDFLDKTGIYKGNGTLKDQYK